MAMARQSTRGWWSHVVDCLFGEPKNPVHDRTTRRLGAESLENRSLMAVAPLSDVAGPSLADYLSEEHRMGPVAPGEFATANADQAATYNLASANPLVLRSLAQGED